MKQPCESMSDPLHEKIERQLAILYALIDAGEPPTSHAILQCSQRIDALLKAILPSHDCEEDRNP